MHKKSSCHQLSKQPKIHIFLIIITAVGIAFILGHHFNHYSKGLQKANEHINRTQAKLKDKLDILNNQPREVLQAHYDQLRSQQHPGLDFIQSLLNQSAYHEDGFIRYLWVDKTNHIRLSSHTQYLTHDLDLSSRDYVRVSRQHPGKMHYSKLLSHLKHQTDIVTLSIGVAHPISGEYQGTLMATLDLQLLKTQLNSLLAHCPCRLALDTPSGKPVMRHQWSLSPLDISVISNGPFTAKFGLSPAWLHAHRSANLTQAGVWSLAYLSLMALIYALIRFRLLKPISQTLAVIAPAHADTPPTLDQLDQVAEHYRELQARLKQQDAIIDQCKGIITALQSQQERFLRASGDEMQQMFAVICDYAQHLEDKVMRQQLDPDAPYEFDDIREMGDNLKLLSDCFLTFATQMELKSESADPKQIIRQALVKLEPLIERRNLSVDLSQNREVWVTQPGAKHWLTALSLSMLYAAIRHAEDEATITITNRAVNEQIHLQCQVSRFRQSTLPLDKQDFGMFIPGLKRDMTEAIRDQLKAHANVLMAEALVARLQGELVLEVTTNPPGFSLRSWFASCVTAENA